MCIIWFNISKLFISHTYTQNSLHFRLCLVRVKAFPENIPFFGNAIFQKGKCFHVFGCISKKFSKNIFWCLEKKKEETKPRKTWTKPRKKKSLNPVKLREEGRERGDWVRRGARSHGGGEGEIGAVLREITIGAKARSRLTARSFTFARSQDRSFSFSFSLCASVSSLCASVSSLCASQFRKSFEVKIGMKMNFRGQSCFFPVKWKWFPENSIFKTNQTAYFTENDFLKPFSPKTNTPLIYNFYLLHFYFFIYTYP